LELLLRAWAAGAGVASITLVLAFLCRPESCTEPPGVADGELGAAPPVTRRVGATETGDVLSRSHCPGTPAIRAGNVCREETTRAGEAGGAREATGGIRACTEESGETVLRLLRDWEEPL
jgi:hypothetical protein